MFQATPCNQPPTVSPGSDAALRASSQAITEKLLKRAVGRASQESGPSTVGSLSDRELEVFRLIGEGRKTQEIAAQLHLSVKTVETYRDRIREKLDLSDGTELARYALQWVLENG